MENHTGKQYSTNPERENVIKNNAKDQNMLVPRFCNNPRLSIIIITTTDAPQSTNMTNTAIPALPPGESPPLFSSSGSEGDTKGLKVEN